MRDCAGRKGVKGLLLVGRGEVPRGLALRSGDLSDTAGHGGRPVAEHSWPGGTRTLVEL